MEDPGGSVAETVTSPPAGAPKSKLDTLSKDDLIKFTKKQMAAMQKMKTKYTDLEKEVATLKDQSKSSKVSSEDTILIQEITERMDALLLEKAETQQSLTMSRKGHEKTKQQAKDDVTMLQEELARAVEDHQRQIGALERSIEESSTKHQEEVTRFQNLLKEREESDRERESERERERQAEQQTNTTENLEEVRRSLEAQLQSLRAELEGIQVRNSKEVADLQENYQRDLTEAQQEVENLREELAQKSVQHEEEMRALEEDCEMERDRLLLLQDELTEQLALKDSYLQDVQEEDEEPARGSGIAKMLELSGCSQGDSSHGDGEETETSRLRAALEDLQAQNTMLQDELTLLGNVKGELEAEVERAREEFQVEREELEFKIDELQMNRESSVTLSPMNSDPSGTLDPDTQEAPREHQQSDPQKDREDALPTSPKEVQAMPSPIQDQQPQQELNQDSQELRELRAQCEALARERDTAVSEYHHSRDCLRGLETELGQRVREVAEEDDVLTEKVQGMELKLQGFLGEIQAAEDVNEKLQASMEEQVELAHNLKISVEGLTRQNEEVLSQLHMKESAAQELEEMVNTLTTERNRTQSLLQLREQEVDRLNEERVKETERLQEEKEKSIQRLREEKERELEHLRKEKEDEVEHLGGGQERVTSLEKTVIDLSADKADLQHRLEEAFSTLSQAQGEIDLLGSQLAALRVQLEQETSEKREVEARIKTLTEEVDQARTALGTLQENQAQALRSSTEEAQDLQARVEELEKERSLLKSGLEEAQEGRRLEEVREELQARIEELEKERSLLMSSLEEVVGDTEGLQKDLEDLKAANEKIMVENQELQARITLVVQEKEDREEGEMGRERETMEKERSELEQQLAEKDSLVAQLRSELAVLQESAAQPAPSEENVSSQLTEKIALLEKGSKEKDQRMIKIKAVAVKAKKELDASKKEVATLKEEVELLKAERERVSSSMKDIIHGAEGYKNLQMDYDRQTEQLDKEREKVEAAERQIAELTKRLSTAITQVETLSSEKEDLLAAMETLRSTVRQQEAQSQELHRHTASLDRDLTAERAIKEQRMKELSLAVKEVEELTAQLRRQQQQSQQTAQELEQLRKEAQQSSLLDMEMADYERLVKELNAKLSENDTQAEELKAQIHTHTQKEDTRNQEIESLKCQLDQGEEKTSKMKQLLVKTKKDLADAKKQEASQMLLQASLRGELEANQQQLESSKIQVCELTAERHRLQEQLRSVSEQQQRTASSLQHRINTLQHETDTTKAELASTAAEFESYKVRVHNVLRQKNKSNAQGEADNGKPEREQLVTEAEQLRARLVDSQQSLQSSTAELQQVQTEHDTLLDRHNKILQETVSKEAELRERLLSVQSENAALRSEQAQAQADLRSQAESQRQGFREQVRRLQDEHRATVETLQGQLTRLEEQLFILQKQSSSGAVQSSRKPLTSDPQRRPQEQGMGGLGFVALGDLQSMAREEGEGMETTDTERSSPARTPLPSLEQLLTSPDPKQEPFVWTVEPTKEELSQKLTTATRSMEHMNSLLHETEATNAILMEQITLLKSEVRRLERNQEREKSVANLEYLKNVLLRFIFLRSGSERQALLPVIHTMLQLSPEEKSKLAAIAHGEEEASGNRGSGWTSYLHSWSGIR